MGDPNPNGDQTPMEDPKMGERGNRRVYGEIYGVRNGGRQGGTSVSMGGANGGPSWRTLMGTPTPMGDPKMGDGGNRRVYGEIYGVRNGGRKWGTSAPMGEPNWGPQPQ